MEPVCEIVMIQLIPPSVTEFLPSANKGMLWLCLFLSNCSEKCDVTVRITQRRMMGKWKLVS